MKLNMPGMGLIKGLGVVLKNLTRRPVTEQYPEQRLTVSRRTRAPELVWDPNRCTGCATCAKACPQGVIKIETSAAEGNKYHVEKFETDTGYCIFCGFCVEACPFDALFMSSGYENGKYRRQDLILGKEALMAAQKHPSAYYHPEPVPGVALPDAEKLPRIEETW